MDDGVEDLRDEDVIVDDGVDVTVVNVEDGAAVVDVVVM